LLLLHVTQAVGWLVIFNVTLSTLYLCLS